MDDYEHGRNVTPLPPALSEFNWHTLVQDILPGEWQLMDEWASKKANMKDILSHVSGLPRYVSHKFLTPAQDSIERELATTTRMDQTTAQRMMYCGCAI
jgi:CubicO group peptidase (beta-lactamase class C family)